MYYQRTWKTGTVKAPPTRFVDFQLKNEASLRESLAFAVTKNKLLCLLL
jgi:hypothetical protein